MAAPELGFGATVEFPGGFTARVLSIKHSGIKREDIDVTYMESADGAKDGYMEFLPSELVDPGELEVEIQHDATQAPPIAEDRQNISYTFASGNGFSCDGYLNEYSIEAAHDGLITATAKMKFSGTPTWS